jgi:hypothetical protein
MREDWRKPCCTQANKRQENQGSSSQTRHLRWELTNGVNKQAAADLLKVVPLVSDHVCRANAVLLPAVGLVMSRGLLSDGRSEHVMLA